MCNITGNEGFADPPQQDKRQLAVFDLLVLTHEAQEMVGIGRAFRLNVGNGGGQAAALEMGGEEFPKPVKTAMTLISKVMTETTYKI